MELYSLNREILLFMPEALHIGTRTRTHTGSGKIKSPACSTAPSISIIDTDRAKGKKAVYPGAETAKKIFVE
jgi:hypothetical protein